MKKILAILLLTVYLFNLAGYPLLFGYLSNQSSHQLSVKIDRHIYQDKDLVEIKVPLQLPYLNSWSNYEPCEGEININGSHHNYVKRKITSDTLYLMCLPNAEKDKLQVAETDYGKSANDFDSKKEDNKSVKKSNSFPQVQLQHTDFGLTPPQQQLGKESSYFSLFIPSSFIDRHDHPPKSNS